MTYTCTQGHTHEDGDTMHSHEVEVDVRTTLRVEAIGAQISPPTMAKLLTGFADSTVVALSATGLRQRQDALGLWQPENISDTWMLRLDEIAQLSAHLERCINALDQSTQRRFMHVLALARAGVNTVPLNARDVNSEIDAETGPDVTTVDFTAGTVNGQPASDGLAAFMQHLMGVLAPLGEPHAARRPAPTKSGNGCGCDLCTGKVPPQPSTTDPGPEAGHNHD